MGRGTARLGETSRTGADRGSLGVLGLAPPQGVMAPRPPSPSITGHPATGREQACTLWPPHTKLYHHLLNQHSPQPALPCPCQLALPPIICHSLATPYHLHACCAVHCGLYVVHLFLEVVPTLHARTVQRPPAISSSVLFSTNAFEYFFLLQPMLSRTFVCIARCESKSLFSFPSVKNENNTNKASA